MALDRVNTTRFMNDNDQAQRSARSQLDFIIANKESLYKVFNGHKKYESARFMSLIKEKYTPKQLSYIDSIYEDVMKGAGFGSFKATYKPRR